MNPKATAEILPIAQQIRDVDDAGTDAESTGKKGI